MTTDAERGLAAHDSRDWAGAEQHLALATDPRRGPADPELVLKLVRALIELGQDPARLDQAEERLLGLLERAIDERLQRECWGFLGRVYKQRFMNLSPSLKLESLTLLEQAIDWYSKGRKDPWRNLNVVILETVRAFVELNSPYSDVDPLEEAGRRTRLRARHLDFIREADEALARNDGGDQAYWLPATVATALTLRAAWLGEWPDGVERRTVELLEEGAKHAKAAAQIDSTLRTFVELGESMGFMRQLGRPLSLQLGHRRALGAAPLPSEPTRATPVWPRNVAPPSYSSDLASTSFGRDDFEEIQGLADAVGWIRDARDFHGSCVLVGPRTVLTCRHVVDDVRDLGRLKVVFRSRDGRRHRHAIDPTALPRGATTAWHHDWALLRLARPATAAPLELVDHAPTAEQKLIVIHYPLQPKPRFTFENCWVHHLDGAGPTSWFTFTGLTDRGSSGGAILDRLDFSLVGIAARTHPDRIPHGKATLPLSVGVAVHAIARQLPSSYEPD